MNELRCPQCGAPVDAGAAECKYCGERLSFQQSAVPPDAGAQQGGYQSGPAYGDGYQQGPGYAISREVPSRIPIRDSRSPRFIRFRRSPRAISSLCPVIITIPPLILPGR